MDQKEAIKEYTGMLAENLSEVIGKAIAFDAFISGDIKLFNQMLRTLGYPYLSIKALEANNFNIWIYPDSSAIRKYRYDDFREELYVQYTSGETIYTFYNVSLDIFKGLHYAESKGKFMNFIKATHQKPFKPY